MKHLSAIDGLRAVAVLAVVAYHAGLPVPAGFVGVDVFFVISGYLITRLLHDEVQATGRIDFLAFYARRARRILPALVVVVLAALALSPALSPVDQQQTARSAAAAFLFAGNVFFAAMPSGYFDATPEAMPLLHLWSLGVEEQFYLLWPVVLILARKRPVVALSVLAVGSFATAEWLLLNGHAQAAFYQMPARAWELALGGLVALRPVTMPKGSAWVALAVVLGACFLPLYNFPGTGALPAVLASAALIAAIQSGDRCALLETRPMVGVGLISYSLYLWHWPALLYGRLWHAPDAALVALPFALAILSYRYVETPVRRRVAHPRVAVMASLLVVMTGVAGAVALPKPIPAPTTVYTLGCDDWYSSARVKPCVFGPAGAPHTAVVIGDSIGLQWFPAIQEIYRAPNWRLIALTKGACPMVDEPNFYKHLGRYYTECEQWRKAALAKVAAYNADVVILGSSDTYEFTQAQWTDGTARILQQLAGHAKQVRILRSTPLFNSATRDDVYQWQQAAAGGFPNVRVVDMNPVVCPRGLCPTQVNGVQVYHDDRHLEVPFVVSLSAPLSARLR